MPLRALLCRSTDKGPGLRDLSDFLSVRSSGFGLVLFLLTHINLITRDHGSLGKELTLLGLVLPSVKDRSQQPYLVHRDV